jgi:hypothetical protein
MTDPETVTDADLPTDGIYVSGIDLDAERADWDYHLAAVEQLDEGVNAA